MRRHRTTAAREARANARGDARQPGATPFPAERQALRKVQVHFEFQQTLMRKVRMGAAAENLSYADYVRKIVGLPYAKIQRPRISLSFGDRDLALLAARYGRAAAETGAIKRCVMDEVRTRLGGEGGDAPGAG